MNLPEKNFEYLDIVASIAKQNPVLLHIYFFAPKNNLEIKAKEILEKELAENLLKTDKILRVDSVKPYNPALDTVAVDIVCSHFGESSF